MHEKVAMRHGMMSEAARSKKDSDDQSHHKMGLEKSNRLYQHNEKINVKAL